MCTSSPIANIAILAVGGALTGGALAAFSPALATTSGLLGLGTAGLTSVGATVATIGGLGAAGGAIIGLGFGLLAASSQGQQAQAQQAQQEAPKLPENESDTTGSGGRDAPRVLARKIREVNRDRSGQPDPTAENLQPQAGTGLQLA